MKMIKLKDLLREQQAQPTVINVDTNTTQDQLAQQTSEIAPGTEITLNFNMGADIPFNEAPSQDLINTVAEKLKMIDNFIDKGEIRVIAHASELPATMKKMGQPGKVEQPAVLRALTKVTSLGGLSISPLTADQFEKNGNSNAVTRGKGNTNLAINRAALLGTAITKSGVSLQKYEIAYDVKINQLKPWVGIEITGTFRNILEKQWLFNVAVVLPNNTIARTGMGNLYWLREGETGQWKSIGSDAAFKSFFDKLAKNQRPSNVGNPELFKLTRSQTAKVKQLLASLNKINNITNYLINLSKNSNIKNQEYIQNWERRYKAAIGVDNIIKLFSNEL